MVALGLFAYNTCQKTQPEHADDLRKLSVFSLLGLGARPNAHAAA
jgi:hypothetical protein